MISTSGSINLRLGARFDAYDNPDVLREVNAISRAIEGKNNVKLIKFHSFEFVLLSFDLLDSWVFAEQDELKEKRRPLL